MTGVECLSQSAGWETVAHTLEDYIAIQRDLSRLKKWLDRNHMKFNNSNSEVLHLEYSTTVLHLVVVLQYYNPMHHCTLLC